MNSRGVDKVPGYKENTKVSIFFVTFMIICAFLMMNLFVGVITSAYEKARVSMGSEFLLTGDQKKWIETKLMLNKINPKLALVRPTKLWNAFCYDIVKWPHFEKVLLTLILLNTLLLTIHWPGMPK